MAEERNTRREILRRILTLGPLAAVAGALGANGINGAKRAMAQTIGDPDVTVTGKIYPGGQSSHYISGNGTGIGIDCAPATLFHIYQPVGNTELRVENAGAGNNPYVSLKSGAQTWELINASSETNDPFFIFDRTNTTARLIVDNTGKVGIGTTSPTSKLVVSDVVQIRGASNPGYPTTGAGFELAYDSDDSVLGGSGAGFFQVYDRDTSAWKDMSLRARAFNFHVGSIEKVRIDTNGNVGIGTTAPGAKLQVNGGASSALRLDANLGVAALSIGGTGEIIVDAPGVYGGRFVVKDSGNVGIGTTSPGARLSLMAPDTSAGVVFQLRQSNNNAYGYDLDTENNVYGRLDLYGVANSVRTHLISIMRDSGNVGIRTTNPQRSLDLSSTGNMTFGDAVTTGTNERGIYWYSGNDYGIYRAAGVWGAPYPKLNIAWYTGIDISANAAYPLLLQTGGGNAGIGTTAPGAKLEVKDGDILITNGKLRGAAEQAYYAA